MRTDTMDTYRATAQRRQAARRHERLAARDRAWHAAGDAAALLCTEFHAVRVLAFGSLVESGGEMFDLDSDIDLAAWGIPDQDFFLAVGRLQSVSREFEFDLLAMEHCPETLRSSIERAGREP
jgi:hypothetical protein